MKGKRIKNSDKKQVGNSDISFTELAKAIKETPSVAGKQKKGLKALGANSTKVSANDSRCFGVSLDLDAALKCGNEKEFRWDYIFDYKGLTYYLEVHPATIGEVKTVIKKYAALKEWLNTDGVKIKGTKQGAAHWVASGKNTVLPTSKEYKQLALSGIKLSSLLKLD